MRVPVSVRIGFIALVATMTPLKSQDWLPVIQLENGDTVQYEWPIPDSAYKPNEVIVLFRPAAIDLDRLCYAYSWYAPGSKPGESVQTIPDYILELRWQVLSER